ncbi:MAG TPA: SMC family ATPase, partial [Anaeromyxobacteraceae bacterium]|nr:SMC family ATPase [Anaeromyxobacteraceae bacterium]
MRPLSLAIQAFGPFEGTQPIDFEALGGGDLFLVHGPTGAGKTTLFDAMTWALFGVVPGTRAPDRLRSDRAAPDLPTRVTFRFRLGEAVYRAERTAAWQRPKKRGQGFTAEDAAASLWREGEAAPLATRPSAVTDAVTALLGMGAAQFTQVALLPQGEFKRLLCADATEREALLQRLFGTERYADLEGWLVDRKNEVEAEVRRLAERRREVLGDEPEEARGERPEALAARLEAARGEAAARAGEDSAALARLDE